MYCLLNIWDWGDMKINKLGRLFLRFLLFGEDDLKIFVK